MAQETVLTTDELSQIIATQDAEKLLQALAEIPQEERARLINRMDAADAERMMMLLPPEDAAALLEKLSDGQAQQLLECVPFEQAAQIADEIHSAARADIVGRMDSRSMDAIMKLMIPEEAEDLRELVSHAPDTAGGLMITEYLVYRSSQTVEEILKDLQNNGQEYADYDIQYAYITDDNDRLVGVLRLRDMLFSPRSRKASEVMIPKPISVVTTDSLEKLQRFFEEHRYFGVPVLNADGALCGVLRRAAVQEAGTERANTMFMRFSGIIGGEEFRNMNLKTRYSRRLSFLTLNILLNVVAASVIAVHSNTLEQIIALAVFLPIISDMGGCSGNQAAAVTIRELSLGLIKPKDYLQIMNKELSVGAINGIALGIIMGGLAYLWKGDIWLSLVAGISLFLSTLVAVIVGGLIPLAVKKLKLDPALVSGPLLTTITDMCGFFFVLTLAAAILI
ncbi:MAG: magnesium transporter [Sumerlaeia bacterium]